MSNQPELQNNGQPAQVSQQLKAHEYYNYQAPQQQPYGQPQVYGQPQQYGQPVNYTGADTPGAATPGGVVYQQFPHQPGQQIIVVQQPNNSILGNDDDMCFAITVFLIGILLFFPILACMPCIFSKSKNPQVKRLSTIGAVLFGVVLVLIIVLFIVVYSKAGSYY